MQVVATHNYVHVHVYMYKFEGKNERTVVEELSLRENTSAKMRTNMWNHGIKENQITFSIQHYQSHLG